MAVRRWLSDLLNYWPADTYQSRWNPIQDERLPASNEAELDFPTQFYDEAANRRHIWLLYIIGSFLCGLLVFTENYTFGSRLAFHYHADIFLSVALLVLLPYVLPRGVADSKPMLVLVWLSLTVLVFVWQDSFFLFCLALACAALLADRFAEHYFWWKTGYPLPPSKARRLRRYWDLRFSSPRVTVCGLTYYPLALASTALFLLPLKLSSMPPTAGPFVMQTSAANRILMGMLLLLFLPWLLQLLLAHRLTSLPRMLRAFLLAFRLWLTYNRRGTWGPGVLESPVGDYRVRRRLSLAILILFAVPIGQHISIQRLVRRYFDTRPVSQTRPQLTFVAYEAADDEPAAATAELEPYQRRMLERLPAEEREQWLRQWTAQTEEPAAPLASPETSLIPMSPRDVGLEAAAEDLAWKSFLMQVYLIVAPGFGWAQRNFAILFGMVCTPLCVLAVAFCATARLLAYGEQTIDTPDRDHLLDSEHWDSLITRLHRSEDAIEKDSVFVGANASDYLPILVPRGVFKEHAHFLGDSGSGKTTLGIAPLVTQLIRFGDASLVLIDLKADEDLSLFDGMRSESAAARLPFRWFTNELGRSSYTFNPLRQEPFGNLSLYQRTELITASMGLQYGTDYGRGYFSDANAELLYHVLRNNPDVQSFAELDSLLSDPAQLHGLRRSIVKDATHLVTIVRRLGATPALNVAPGPGVHPAVLEQQVQFTDCFRKPQVLYFYLPSALGSTSAPEIARFALYSLLTAAKSVSGERRQVYLVIDEFQRIVAKNLELFLQQARSMNIGVILANQSFADLKTADVDLVPAVRGNCRYRQSFSLSEFADQKQLIEASGERVLLNRSWSEAVFGRRRLVSISATESIAKRLNYNDVLLAGDHPQQSIVQIRRGAGYAQYGGMPFVMTSPFHITSDEYDERRRANWPPPNDGTIVATNTFSPLPPQPDPVIGPETPPPPQDEPTNVSDNVDDPGPFDRHWREQQERRGKRAESDESSSSQTQEIE